MPPCLAFLFLNHGFWEVKLRLPDWTLSRAPELCFLFVTTTQQLTKWFCCWWSLQLLKVPLSWHGETSKGKQNRAVWHLCNVTLVTDQLGCSILVLDDRQTSSSELTCGDKLVMLAPVSQLTREREKRGLLCSVSGKQYFPQKALQTCGSLTKTAYVARACLKTQQTAMKKEEGSMTKSRWHREIRSAQRKRKSG